MNFDRIFLKDQIKENTSIEIFRQKKFDNVQDSLLVTHVGLTNIIATCQDSFEQTFLLSYILSEYQLEKPSNDRA